MHFLRLIRYPNLLIIILTMVLMRYGIIQPILGTLGLTLEFPLYGFISLVMSVVLIAASGYLINDYFDVQADTINRPDTVVIGKYIKPETAYRIYYILNFCALVPAFYISYKIKTLPLFIIFPVTIGLLWFYSTTYKRQFLVGNILVSVIIGSIPFLVALYEIPPVFQNNREYLLSYHLNFNIIFTWIGVFALFAFLVNLVREFIKDTEDFEGDMLYGRKTLPIVLGISATKIIITTLTGTIILALGWVYFKYLRLVYLYNTDNTNSYVTSFDIVTFFYFLLLIFIPLLVVLYLIITATEKKQYTLSSQILKLVLLAGSLFAIVVRFKVN